MKVVKSASLTGFVFGLLGWVYIVINATVHPETLSWGLTHFAPWPREDTFGAICFAISIISFFIYNLVRDNK